MLLAAGLASDSLSAQPTQDQLAANEAYDLGAEAMLAGDYKKARRFFTRSVKFRPDFTEAWRLLAEAEMLSRNYLDATIAYREVLRQDSTFSRYLYYELGDAYYKMDRPELALHYYRRFQELQAKDVGDFGIRGEQEFAEEVRALDELPVRLQAIRIQLDSVEFINVTEIYNLGPPINSSADDYFPFFSNDGRSLLLTRRNDNGDEDLLLARRRQTNAESWNVGRLGSFNTKQPEGMITLARDGERIFFTLCRNVEDGQGGCDVYAGLWIDNRVQDVQPLEDYVNSGRWDSQAGISCDGRTLFFASTREGGLGGSDLYYCRMQEDGHWSRPRNLGAPVNSAGDEEAPFLSNDGQTLYFSSTGHPGLGDQDIFMSWWDQKKERWTNVINLGPPVNSPHRELGFHLTADNRTGYFASDRPGGRGGLDIYRFRLSQKLHGDPITYVSGFVLDSLTGAALPDQVVRLNGGGVFRTNRDGRFFLCAGADEVLDFQLDNPDYRPYQNSFAIPTWDNLYPYRIDLLLVGESTTPALPPIPPPPPSLPEPDTVKRQRLVVRNLSILFNFNDATLIPYQRTNLDFFIDRLGDATIESVSITGYADDIGTPDYNLELSENRARAVATYLNKVGIPTDRVSLKGLGSISGGARELNRRVELEVKVLEEW